MARRAKRVAAAAERSWQTIFLPSPKLRRGCHAVTGEDCCLIIRKGFFNKDNINYKTSILYRHSAVASCHFPRLLGKARLYFLIVPLLKQRFREMKGALRSLNMTKNFCISAVNRLIRPFFVFLCVAVAAFHTLSFRARRSHPPVIPSVAEESRGNEKISVIKEKVARLRLLLRYPATGWLLLTAPLALRRNLAVVLLLSTN